MNLGCYVLLGQFLPAGSGRARAFDSLDECREVVHRQADASLDCVEVKIGWGP